MSDNSELRKLQAIIDDLADKVLDRDERIKVLEEVLLVQKEIAGRTMTDIVAAANKDATDAVDRIGALEAALEVSDTLGKFWQARAIKAEGIPAAIAAQPLTTDTIDLTNPLPGDPPIQQQPNSAVFPGFRGNNES